MGHMPGFSHGVMQAAGDMQDVYFILDDINKLQRFREVRVPSANSSAEIRYSMTKFSPTSSRVASSTSTANRARF